MQDRLEPQKLLFISKELIPYLVPRQVHSAVERKQITDERTNIFRFVICMKLKHIFARLWANDDQHGIAKKRETCIFKKLAGNYKQKHTFPSYSCLFHENVNASTFKSRLALFFHHLQPAVCKPGSVQCFFHYEFFRMCIQHSAVYENIHSEVQ